MFAGVVGDTIAFLTIRFAKDIGYTFGDNLSEYTQHRPLIIFWIRLWMLGISIMPAVETFLMILPAETNQRLDWHNSSSHSSWQSETNWIRCYVGIPVTKACDSCGCVLRPEQVSITEEESSEREEEDDRCTLVKCFREMFRTMKRLNKPMLCLMAAELFNWVALYGFF
ncbi:hypothetical protein Ahy_A04g017976 [Arachis hypogaea]|uniref:Uncharacterized protein n=1 Tax=Arachis hypogaea TaxID=3818 RepID=A0A445DCJ1_ARAHY|nr:hypothetical protein Ahy_A04g017976 [Arachis hypogaea]